MKKLLFGILSLSIIVNPYYVFAEEIVVSGNGSDSSSNVTVNFNNSTNVTQNNNATINNNVDINADTGNNTADNNTGGDTSVTTGDVSTASNIENNGINENSVDLTCCNQNDTSIDINGNGANSDNSAKYSQNNNTTVSINNTANIINTVQGKANTGYNEANDNTGGSVWIKTGSINVSDTIKNNSVNIYDIQVPSGTGGDVSLTIKENGAGSNNSLTFANDSNVAIDIENSANIVNNSNWDLNTGHNKANGNTGEDVSIATGDILLASTIDNTGINVGLVDIECCNLDHNNPLPDENPPPPPPPTGGGSNCTSNCSIASASSNPGAGQPVLPVTGSDEMLFLMIGNILMFFLGGYLRLRSGRAPSYLFAK